jgi:outer membrane lipoprotein-sorting protein
LARDFRLTVVPSPLPGTYALKLIPKLGTQVMQSLQLVVDRRTFAVKASILIDPLGDSTTLMFSQPNYQAIADKVFDWSPPKGVTIKTL